MSNTKKVQRKAEPPASLARCANEPSLIRAFARKNDELFATVRRLALEQQCDHPQHFLSLREAARRFDVPVATAAEIYRRLHREGILSSVRGSGTMLSATRNARVLKVARLIGMPVSVRQFSCSRDYRDSFLHVRDELLARGFGTHSLFFHDKEVTPVFFARRFADAGVDAVVWILPDSSTREAVLHVRDRGIQIFGVSIAGGATMRCRYEVRRREAVRAILLNWHRKHGVQEATVMRAADETPAMRARMKRLEAIAVAAGVECTFVALPKKRTGEAIANICARQAEAVVMSGPVAELLAAHDADAAEDVLASRRVALIDGPLDLPLTHPKGEPTADIVTIDWRAIARRVAADAMEQGTAIDNGPVVFQARHQLRVQLRGLTCAA